MNSQFSDLIKACHYESDTKKVEEILKKGDIDINYSEANGITILMYAAGPIECECHDSITQNRKKKELIEYLLNKGSDVNLKDKLGFNAIDHLKRHLDPEWKDFKGENAVKNYTEDQIKMFEELIELMEAFR